MTPDFKLSLLREKFTLKDLLVNPSDVPPVIALSNRISLPLSSEGEPPETFVIRTQNMHSCVRFAAAIAKEYAERGAITQRVMKFSWNNLWDDVTKGYERDWNPDIWCAVYHKGRPIYEQGPRHPFLDIIEQCDAANRENYKESVAFAEKAFLQAGRTVKIDHDSNIALIVSINDEEAKCGVILRGANRKTTFNYTVKKKPSGEVVRVPTILTVAAAFLEGVQLAFAVGVLNRKRALDLFEKFSDEDRKGKRGTERLTSLAAAIETMERKYWVTYRPDSPNFKKMVRDAEDFAMTILKPQIEAKIARGELDGKDWVH